MQLEVFRGRDMRSLMAWVERSLGDEALIVRTNVLPRPDGDVYEVLVAPPAELAAYREKVAGPHLAERMTGPRDGGPLVIAVVGPPGAGKTTAAMKLALHPYGIGETKIGLLTLDTHRVGAVDEMQTYSEVAGLPLEVVYHPREVAGALERLGHVDAIVVDTPGRDPEGSAWGQALRALQPDEVHLVVPATVRRPIARSYRADFRATEPTHALFTKLDQLPGDVGLSDLAEAVDMPVRWVSDGYEVPGVLASGSGRIVRSLGKRSPSVDRLVAG